MTRPEGTWHEENQRYLVVELQALRGHLERHLAPAGSAPAIDPPPEAHAPGFVSNLDRLTRVLGLSPFERSILLFCAAVELDGSLPGLIAQANGDPRRIHPTFGLSMTLLPKAHWSALVPAAPLRRWRLVEVGPGESLMQSPLRIEERVLHYLVGLEGLDARLESSAEPASGEGELAPSHEPVIERLAALWSSALPALRPVALLCGGDRVQRAAITAEAARRLGMTLLRLRPAGLPTNHQELGWLQRLWEREALLSNGLLLLEWPEDETPELRRAATLLAQALRCPLVLGARTALHLDGRASVRLELEPPRAEEGRLLWRRYLGTAATGLEERIDELATQFHLGPTAIQAATASAIAASGPALRLEQALWAACRSQSRPRLEDLAQRIEALATWDDLVLPEPQEQLLREIVTHVRHRGRVYDTWGFADRTRRGLGISALFSGPSGTGKTMAAEVMAAELELDLYRVDLSQVVSKYIGETEKNLRRIFDAADEGGGILLFDEADALFGKRSEVRDSHDRYANLEVSYLLQRMEEYRGLAILTTNFKSALDLAFMRRLRFVVQFPFPDAVQRQEIWRRVFPRRTPLDALDYARLARVNIAGGNIRNIALNAAFMAAAEGGPLGMAHLLRATRMEYTKLDKPLTDAEVAGWL